MAVNPVYQKADGLWYFKLPGTQEQGSFATARIAWFRLGAYLKGKEYLLEKLLK